METVRHHNFDLPADIANIASFMYANCPDNSIERKAVMMARAISDRNGYVDQITELQSRIASLEAERDKAVELLREIVPSSKCDLRYPSYCWPHGEKAPCPIGEAQAFLALVGGEVKNG